MRRTLLTFLLLPLFAYSQPPSPGPAKSGQPPQQQATPSQKQPSSNQDITIRAPVDVKLLNTGKTDKEAAEDAREREDESSARWWAVGLTGLIGLFAALQLIAFVMQAVYMGRTHRSATDTAKRQLRAYLGIGSGEVYILPNDDPLKKYVLRGQIQMQNFGDTPAHHVRPAIAGALCKLGECRFERPAQIAHQHYIAPTMHWTIGHDFPPMSDSELEEVISRRMVVYIWGFVTFEDIYGKKRTLNYRFRNVVTQWERTPEGGMSFKWFYYPEEEGNDETEG